jgi:hypothetical protein
LAKLNRELNYSLDAVKWSRGPFYYSSLNIGTLNRYMNDHGNYLFWTNVITQQTQFFKWMRWLYRYSILHRNLLNHSRKLTSFKKLFSTGFFSTDLTEKNLWTSNYLATTNSAELLKTSWLTFYRDTFGAPASANIHLVQNSATTKTLLPTLSTYEHSYFFFFTPIWFF